ncbi:MAG: TonB-dependent receptor [Pseudomonas sp.]|uniref:TonB-dependent siderophore receptor n=1 Tax=Pseudomonas sp. TaxID=306 RepID=UPI0030F2B8B2
MKYKTMVKNAWGFSLALTASLPLLSHAAEAPSTAAQAQYNFAITAQPLPQALSAFSRVTGLSLVYSDDAPYSLQAPAVRGEMSAEQALSQLLQGSGYTFRRADERTLTLQRLPSEGALNLDATNIDGNTHTAQGYQPPPTSKIMRSEAPLLEIPQAIAVVPQQVLQDQQPRNLDDALVNVSGITQANTLGSTMDAVMKRGFGDNRDGSILRDGMRTIQGRNFTANVERVEVLKGPASMLYGILDPGGVINLISKKPQLQQYNAITARASTYGDGKNGSGGQLDTTGAIGDTDLAYRLVADYDDADYWRNFGNSREKTIAPSLAWLADDTTVNVSWEHRDYLTPFDRGTILNPDTKKPLAIPRERRLDEPYNKTEGRSDLAIVDIEHRLNDQWKTHFAYSYNRDRYDDYQARVTGFVGTDRTRLVRRLDGTRGAVSTEHFGTLDLSGDLEFAGMRHEVLTGVDHEYRKIFRSDLLRQTTTVRFNTQNPVYGQVPIPTTVTATDSDQTDKVYSQSAFIQDSIHLDDQWILVAGARYQLYDQLAGRGRPFNKNTDINGQNWLPRVGVVYQWNEVFSLYGGYSESFKPSSTIAPLSGGVSLNGLEPEQGKSWEVGAKLDMPGRITGTLALFNIDKENVQVTETLNAGTPQAELVSRAAGAVTSRGIELDITGQVTDQISLIGTYAYLDAWVTKDPALKGNDLVNVARNTGSLFGVYDFGQVLGGDRLRIGTGARYVGERAGDAENTFTLPAYTVADAFASYDTQLGGKKVKLQFNVKNMFDKTYYSSSTNPFLISIGDARLFEVSSTLEF